MAAEQTNKPRSKHEDVFAFLDEIDTKYAAPRAQASASAAPSTSATPAAGASGAHAASSQPEDAQTILDIIDEITLKSSAPTATMPTKKPPGSALASAASRPLSRQSSGASLTTNPRIAVTEPSGRKSTDSARSARSMEVTASTPEPGRAAPTAEAASATGGWGWGSVFKQATTVLQQAKTVAEQARTVAEGASKSDLVKNLNQGIQQQLSGQGDNAKKWGEGVMNYVKTSGIDQIGKDLQATGLKSLTDIINAVAPPIAEHEIIEVQLSYDMLGYDGIENLVYRSLSKIMEQVEGGDLVLNKGEEEKPKERGPDDPERDLQAVEGMQEAYKLAQANLEALIKRKYKAGTGTGAAARPPANEAETQDAGGAGMPQITNCPVFVRIQPLLCPLPTFPASGSAATAAPSASGGPVPPGTPLEQERHLFFLILLRDPTNELSHATMSQSMPATWLDIPFEENEWVEDVMVEVIRRATEVIGQQYVNGRLTGRSIKNAANARASTESVRSAREVPVSTAPAAA